MAPRMRGPKGWTTSQQFDLLMTFFSEYENVSSGSSNYGNFWAKVTRLWFQEYPELEVLFPGREESSLTEEEAAQVGTAINATTEVHLILHYLTISNFCFRELSAGTDGESMPRPTLAAVQVSRITCSMNLSPSRIDSSSQWKCIPSCTTRPKSNRW